MIIDDLCVIIHEQGNRKRPDLITGSGRFCYSYLKRTVIAFLNTTEVTFPFTMSISAMMDVKNDFWIDLSTVCENFL